MRWLAITALLALCASPASSAILRVERDGSAPYTTIQPAIDDAAPGDTIQIGPGRYTEHQTATLHLWDWSIEVYALVRTDSLTIMGTNRDGVVIGPDTASFHDFGPQAIAFDNVVGGDVRSLTAVNTYDGVFFSTRVSGSSVIGSAFRGCGYGVTGFCGGPLVVTQCEFTWCTDSGAICDSPTPRFELSESNFIGNSTAVNAVATPSVSIRDCSVTGGDVGIQFEQGSVGEIVDCHFSDVRYAGINATLGAVIDMHGVTVKGGMKNLSLRGGRVTGSDCVFSGASGATISCPDWPTFTLHNCHILRGGGWLVELAQSNFPPIIHADLRNNYWGIADRDSIAALIWDGTDDPTINGIVDFEPFSATPLPTEKKSLGGVKSLYR